MLKVQGCGCACVCLFLCMYLCMRTCTGPCMCACSPAVIVNCMSGVPLTAIHWCGTEFTAGLPLLPYPFSFQPCWWAKVGQLPFTMHTHLCMCMCVCEECSGQCPDMLDSWEICQPSAWAFQTMPHNVLDSPEKQPGAWKLPAHHLNSLIWALSGFPSPSFSPALCLWRCSLPPYFIPLLIYPPCSHFSPHKHTLWQTPPSTFSFHSFFILEHMTNIIFATLHKMSLSHTRVLVFHSFPCNIAWWPIWGAKQIIHT